MIEAKNISFTYSNGKTVLRNISLSIRDGVTVLMGPNGSGKTTLLKILGLIYKPSGGEVFIDGENYWGLPKEKQIETRRKLVYLHEKPRLFKGSVLDNVAYPLTIRGYPKEEAKEKARKILEELGIAHLENRRRKQLSAGEAQLVSYARAAITNPKHMILDEPTNTLDRQKREAIENHIKKITKKGTSVVIATHDTLLALKTATKIITLENGQKTTETTPKQLLKEIQIETQLT